MLAVELDCLPRALEFSSLFVPRSAARNLPAKGATSSRFMRQVTESEDDESFIPPTNG
jgi:hypothetical protein